MKFQSVKGMDDLFGSELLKWQILEERSRRYFEANGFREIRTPIVESTELFQRSIGEASDIVHKEMYTFTDRGGRSLTMRPEMTASVVRAAIEHNLLADKDPVFIYYMGPMFRAERPQAGRKRQFHQIGIETLNTHSAVNDAELILLIQGYLELLGLKKYKVKLNHLGSSEARTRHIEALGKYFKSKAEALCDDCRFRLEKNILRILDCKNPSCQPVISGAPRQQLDPESESSLNEIVSILKANEVPFTLEPRLVRGLDYYTGFVFEVTAEGLGAQDALLAGGRYDHLIQELGGPKSGASGFSVGVERLLTALEANGVKLETLATDQTVYIAGMVHGKDSCTFYRQIARALDEAGKRAHFSFSDASLSNHLKKANKLQAGYVLIVGEDEWKAREVSLKDMVSGTQQKIKIDQLSKGFTDA